ncbi:hypothetical protein D3C80_1457270 [compost metagenome]
MGRPANASNGGCPAGKPPLCGCCAGALLISASPLRMTWPNRLSRLRNSMPWARCSALALSQAMLLML